jgi:CRISPR/Cas system CSM-associated protein Csm4 (group 5 of RAMP superfamily)
VEVEQETAFEGGLLHYFLASDPDMDGGSQVAEGVHTTSTYCRLSHSEKNKIPKSNHISINSSPEMSSLAFMEQIFFNEHMSIFFFVSVRENVNVLFIERVSLLFGFLNLISVLKYMLGNNVLITEA